MLESGALPGGPVRYFADIVEGRRGELLDAALTVFSSKGYDSGTMREIAAVVGVTEPALYRHYAGKESLYEDLIATAGGIAVAEVRRRMEDVRRETVRESLADVIASGPHRRGGPGGIARMLIVSTPHRPVLLEAFRSCLAQPMYVAIREFVPRVDAFYGITRDATEADGRARAIMSLLVGYFMTSMMLGEAGCDDAIVDAVMATMGWEAPARKG